MITPEPPTPAILDYGSKPTKSRRFGKYAIRLVAVVLLLTGAWFGWKYGKPIVQRYLAAREVGKRMVAIDAALAATMKQSLPQDATSLPILTRELAGLTGSLRTLHPRGSPMVAVFNVLNAGALADPAGRKRTILVCGTAEHASALFWPTGSTDPADIRFSFLYSIGNNITPASRIAFPPRQPVPSATSIPMETLVDGVTKYSNVFIDPAGDVVGSVRGWRHQPSSAGDKMFWGEVGRYGYRNISLSVADLPPARSVAHSSEVVKMRFMPDGRLAAVMRGSVELIDPAGGKPGIYTLPSSKWVGRQARLSRDGTRFIVPPDRTTVRGVLDLTTGTTTPLPIFENNGWKAFSLGFESSDRVLMVNHFQVTSIEGTSPLKEHDLIATAGGKMAILSAQPERSRLGPSSVPAFSATEKRLVIGHLNGLQIFNRTNDGWSESQRLGDWIGATPCLSNDSRWLGMVETRRSSIRDLRRRQTVFETSSGIQYGSDEEAFSWSDDGSLAAFIPTVEPVLVTLGTEKLAIQIELKTQNPLNGFSGTICLSPDGKQLAVKDNVANLLMIWQTADVLTAARRAAAAEP